ncbi:hypothetical protein ACJZ2D_007802 [Fusarium nematophilum]
MSTTIQTKQKIEFIDPAQNPEAVAFLPSDSRNVNSPLPLGQNHQPETPIAASMLLSRQTDHRGSQEWVTAEPMPHPRRHPRDPSFPDQKKSSSEQVAHASEPLEETSGSSLSWIRAQFGLGGIILQPQQGTKERDLQQQKVISSLELCAASSACCFHHSGSARYTSSACSESPPISPLKSSTPSNSPPKPMNPLS